MLMYFDYVSLLVSFFAFASIVYLSFGELWVVKGTVKRHGVQKSVAWIEKSVLFFVLCSSNLLYDYSVFFKEVFLV